MIFFLITKYKTMAPGDSAYRDERPVAQRIRGALDLDPESW
jgi:hypothetical protein